MLREGFRCSRFGSVCDEVVKLLLERRPSEMLLGALPGMGQWPSWAVADAKAVKWARDMRLTSEPCACCCRLSGCGISGRDPEG